MPQNVEPPRVESLKVGWIREILPETIMAYRKLRRTKLLQLYSMQHYAIYIKKCLPGGDYCLKSCQARKEEEKLVGMSGPLFCSLVRAILATEMNFYKMHVSEGEWRCNLCGEVIPKGHGFVLVPLFGYGPLSLCLRCIMYDEFDSKEDYLQESKWGRGTPPK